MTDKPKFVKIAQQITHKKKIPEDLKMYFQIREERYPDQRLPNFCILALSMQIDPIKSRDYIRKVKILPTKEVDKRITLVFKMTDINFNHEYSIIMKKKIYSGTK